MRRANFIEVIESGFMTGCIRSMLQRVRLKKMFLLVVAILLAGSGEAFAQKRNVSRARAKILAEVPDTKAAKEAILPALEDSITNILASTWFVAGEVFYTIYDEQQKKQWTTKNQDYSVMGEALKSALSYYSIADSLDMQPDKKGRIRPKYSSKIVERTLGFQRGFTDAGSHFYGEKEFLKALDMFKTYLSYPSIPFLKDKALEKDTLIPLLTYYCGLCATQANLPEVAVTYYEQVKDSIDSEWIYARLSDDYAQLKDTSNMLRMYQLGAQKFPKEPFYARNLINYYINKNLMKEAMIWIETAIVQDEKSAPLWNVKGRILENEMKLEEAIVCYEKAIELDSLLADALGNIGRIYYNHAVEELERVNAIRDDRTYRKEKLALKKTFDKGRPYFERAREINPDERDFIIALRGIYYNLDMNDKYNTMDSLLKNMNK